MPSISSLLFAVTALVAVTGAHPVAHDHDHVEAGGLPGDWYHPQDHPVNNLFRRADAPASAPVVGSPEWIAKYPKEVDTPGTVPSTEKDLPAAWVSAYKAAVANGKIPAIPPTVADYMQGTAKYPDGIDPSSHEVCSTYEQCYIASDLVTPTSGVVAISFDDGPAAGSAKLYEFLGQQHQRATHFLIGSNIRDQPDLFLKAYRQGGDLAVHTWTHPYLTSLSDYSVLAELGWTMQIIYDSTGGRVPRFFRPPFGDSDNRIRAIASEVFGLRPVIWNHDTNDWAIGSGMQTLEGVKGNVTEWLDAKNVASPEGVMMLEHELTNDTAGAFIQYVWPLIQQNKWKALSVAQLWGDHGSAYANAASNSDVPKSQDVASAPQKITVSSTSTLPPWATALPQASTSASSSSSAAPAPPPSSAPAPAPSSSSPAPAPAPTTVAGGGAGAPPVSSIPAPPSTSSDDTAPTSGSTSTDTDGNNGAVSALSSPRYALAAAAALAVLLLA